MKRRKASAGLGILLGMAVGAASNANPVGPQVSHGQVTFSSPSPDTLNVTNSNGAIINWQGFSIGAGEVTRFVQPGAASRVLNRVVGSDPSSILGRLASNGRVFLINPQGILFGPGAVVDTAGLVASTLAISDADFLAGRLAFEAGPGAGSIENRGYVRVGPGGEVVLIAPNITNGGVIETDGGRLVLAAGRKLTLTSLASPDVQFEVQAPGDEVVNLGALLTGGGAASLFASAIHNRGLVSADAVTVGPGGEVRFEASRRITLDPGSEVTASGNGGGDGGMVTLVAGGAGAGSGAANGGGATLFQFGEVHADGARGGDVTLAADRVLAAAAVTADGGDAGGAVAVGARSRLLATAGSVVSARGGTGPGGTISVHGGASFFTSGTYDAGGAVGGVVALSGDAITLAAATVDVSGEAGGGTIRIGGDPRGAPALPVASRTVVNVTTRLDADALGAGDGGEVVVFGADEIRAEGEISARGGPGGGDGGFVEVSGHGGISLADTVDVGAPAGTPGTLLIDPVNIKFVPGTTPIQVELGFVELFDPNPGAGNAFGAGGTVSTDFRFGRKVLILDPNDDLAGVDSGAAYYFDLADASLVSALVGAGVGDKVGSAGFRVTADGNFFVFSPEFAGEAGAMSLGLKETGIGGVLSAANSFVGANPDPDGGGPLVGDRVGDAFAGGIFQRYFELPDFDKALVLNPNWNGERGGATLLSTTTPPTGVMGPGNSMVGTTAGDMIGSDGAKFFDTDNFVFGSSEFTSDINGNASVGALTFGRPVDPLVGFVNSTNSFTGVFTNDRVGNFTSGRELPGNDLFLARTNSFTINAGAVTPISTVTGLSPHTGARGQISSANSLVGNNVGDSVAAFTGDIRVLPNENYVITSFRVDEQHIGANDAGAVTFGIAATGGAVGVVTANPAVLDRNLTSIFGTTTNDRVGEGFRQLQNGNFVIGSPDWTDAANARPMAGALTFGTQAAGFAIPGPVNAANSFIGANAGDQVGDRLFSSSNFVEISGQNKFLYRTTNFAGAGAVTKVDSNIGIVGPIGAGNSLVGGTAGDNVGSGGLRVLANGNFFIGSPSFDDDGPGPNVLRGALTHGTAGAPLIGPITTANSLLGSNDNDQIGGSIGGTTNVVELAGNRALVRHENFDTNASAVTLVDTATGNPVLGPADFVGAANSLVGPNPGDQVGSGGIRVFSNGNYWIGSPEFTPGPAQVGAITFGTPTAPPIGPVAGGNSFTGGFAMDRVGDSLNSFATVRELFGTGKAIVTTPAHNVMGGAVSVVGTTGATFIPALFMGPGNSLVGNPGDQVGSGGVTVLSNNDYVVLSPQWGTGKGAITKGTSVPAMGTIGTVGMVNSLVGVNADPDGAGALRGDEVGSGGIRVLGNGNFFIGSPSNDNDRGGLTFGTPASVNLAGNVNTTNSFLGVNPDPDGVGPLTGDRVGDNLFGAPEISSADLILFRTAGFNQNASAVTPVGRTAGITGTIGPGNSLVGSSPGDMIGSGGVQVSGDNYFVISPQFGGTIGAVTYAMGAGGGLTGTVGAGNSLVGAGPGDMVGSGGVVNLFAADAAVVLSPNFAGMSGAVTHSAAGTGTGFDGVVSAQNSLVGGQAGDRVGGNGIRILGTGDFVVRSRNWNMDRGAMTPASGTDGITGVVTAANSLVGVQPGDMIGSSELTNSFGDFLAISPGADVGAADGAGRIHVLSTVVNPSLAFSDRSGEDVEVGVTNVRDFLDGGGSAIFQANNDITSEEDADIFAFFGNGSLTLQAGRSILLHGDIVIPGIVNLFANEVSAPGVNLAERGPGPGNVHIEAARIVGAEINVSGSNVTLQGGSAAVLQSLSGPVTVIAGTPAAPGFIEFLAGVNGGDALIISEQGEGVVNLTFGTCNACFLIAQGNDAFNALDPFNNGFADLGIIAGTLNITRLAGDNTEARILATSAVLSLRTNLLGDDDDDAPDEEDGDGESAARGEDGEEEVGQCPA